MLTYGALLQNEGCPSSPERDSPRKRQESTASNMSINDPNVILSTTNPDRACDCDSYQVNNMACPCSARHAARMGRRATERILHRSPFFQSRDLKPYRTASNSKLGRDQSSLALLASAVQEFSSGESSDNVEIGIPTDSTMTHAADEKWAQNKIIELDPSEVEVIKLLGQGGFCEVHAARLVSPEAATLTTPLAASNHDGHHKLRDDVTVTSMTASHSTHSFETDMMSTPDQSQHSQYQQTSSNKLQHLLGRDYCIKFLKPSTLAHRKKFARGTADLCIEAHFLAVLSHPHILRLRGVTEGFKLFNPGSSGTFLRNLTHYAGREGCCFVLLDRLHSTLDEKIGGCWKHESDKLHGLMYKVGWRDMRGSRRRALKLQLLTCAIQVAEALRYLHDHRIVYRDLKPDNIGFDSDGMVKIFDFGLVKELKTHRRYADGTYLLSANTGSRRYMAPEVAKKERYNLSADVYSFGILLWEICTLEKPFEGYTETEHTNFVLNMGRRPKLDGGAVKGWPTEVMGLMKKCWDQDLHQRPNFGKVLEALKDAYKTLAKGSAYVSMEDQAVDSNGEGTAAVVAANMRTVAAASTDDVGCCIAPVLDNDTDAYTVTGTESSEINRKKIPPQNQSIRRSKFP